MAGVNPLAYRREELFSAFLDGELSTGEAELVNEILAGEEAAMEEFRGIQQVRKALRTLPDLEIPGWLLPDGHLGEQLSAYLDGELSAAEQREVSDHVINCADCRAQLHDLDRARIAVRSLPGVETGQFDKIPVFPRSRRRRAVAAGSIGIAAAVAVILGLAFGGQQQPSISLDDLTTFHIARASAEPGFAIFPSGIEVSAP
ncbi:MAG: hypothetical protein BMS9Abin07_2361 [Acidimicrobiia bacterium]|nr:MAG: hypothetical protein BMS9Abin07_2361 [Acidimicrobiia bacterium]